MKLPRADQGLFNLREASYDSFILLVVCGCSCFSTTNLRKICEKSNFFSKDISLKINGNFPIRSRSVFSSLFNEPDKDNSLRNRIAHHETICFSSHTSTINTSYVINIYTKIKTLFS